MHINIDYKLDNEKKLPALNQLDPISLEYLFSGYYVLEKRGSKDTIKNFCYTNNFTLDQIQILCP